MSQLPTILLGWKISITGTYVRIVEGITLFDKFTETGVVDSPTHFHTLRGRFLDIETSWPKSNTKQMCKIHCLLHTVTKDDGSVPIAVALHNFRDFVKEASVEEELFAVVTVGQASNFKRHRAKCFIKIMNTCCWTTQPLTNVSYIR